MTSPNSISEAIRTLFVEEGWPNLTTCIVNSEGTRAFLRVESFADSKSMHNQGRRISRRILSLLNVECEISWDDTLQAKRRLDDLINYLKVNRGIEVGALETSGDRGGVRIEISIKSGSGVHIDNELLRSDISEFYEGNEKKVSGIAIKRQEYEFEIFNLLSEIKQTAPIDADSLLNRSERIYTKETLDGYIDVLLDRKLINKLSEKNYALTLKGLRLFSVSRLPSKTDVKRALHLGRIKW